MIRLVSIAGLENLCNYYFKVEIKNSLTFKKYMEKDFPIMGPFEKKQAIIKQGQMLQEGAEITESGLEATPEQIEVARKEMLVEKTMKKAGEIVDSLGLDDLSVVIEKLKKDRDASGPGDPDKALRESLISFLVSVNNSTGSRN